MFCFAIISFTVLLGAIGILFYVTYNPKKQNKSQMLNKTKYGINRLTLNTRQLTSELPPTFALITDLDHTLIGIHSNQTHEQCNQHIKQFNDIWCNKYATNNGILIYATGRNFEKYQLAVKEWDILTPDILISQDGVNIHWFNKSLMQQVLSKSSDKLDTVLNGALKKEDFIYYDISWQNILEHGWNQKFAQTIHDELYVKYSDQLLSLPPSSYSIEPFRIGVLCKGYEFAKESEKYFQQRICEYNENNKEREKFIPMKIHTFIGAERYQENAYWSAVTPSMAGKGSAIKFLMNKLDLNEGNIVCIGDSGNDISMMEINGVNSVVVANASHELMDFYEQKRKNGNIVKTDQPNVLGVIEGLEYYESVLIQ